MVVTSVMGINGMVVHLDMYFHYAHSNRSRLLVFNSLSETSKGVEDKDSHRHLKSARQFFHV